MVSKASGVSLLSLRGGSVSDDSCVDGARYAVRGLNVDLGHLEVSLVERVVFLDISL